jgi:transcriptional regulator with XRE-family HTH domain
MTIKITNLLSDEAILAEIGQRVRGRRIELNMTQADLADKAGIAKPTVENIERGTSGQLSTIIRILRALDLMDNLDRLIPEPVPRPMDLLKRKKKLRVRASKKEIDDKKTGETWTWKEDE